MTDDPDRAAVKEEMDQARQDFRRVVTGATVADLRRRSDGTKWTNQELLFHMLFGYVITRRALLVLVRVFSRLPSPVGKAFAQLLDAAVRPFNTINYLGSRLGARLIPPDQMLGRMDKVITALEQSLDRQTAAALRRGMYFPVKWDPFFTGYMTLADLYHYPTEHFRFHQRQLSLIASAVVEQ